VETNKNIGGQGDFNKDLADQGFKNLASVQKDLGNLGIEHKENFNQNCNLGTQQNELKAAEHKRNLNVNQNLEGDINKNLGSSQGEINRHVEGGDFQKVNENMSKQDFSGQGPRLDRNPEDRVELDEKELNHAQKIDINNQYNPSSKPFQQKHKFDLEKPEVKELAAEANKDQEKVHGDQFQDKGKLEEDTNAGGIQNFYDDVNKVRAGEITSQDHNIGTAGKDTSTIHQGGIKDYDKNIDNIMQGSQHHTPAQENLDKDINKDVNIIHKDIPAAQQSAINDYDKNVENITQQSQKQQTAAQENIKGKEFDRTNIQKENQQSATL